MKAIEREIEELKRRIEKMPKIWRFHGRKVVPVDKWEPGDWTTLPDGYHIRLDLDLKPPSDWWKDYIALRTKLEDPTFGWRLCSSCAINLAQYVRKEIERHSWADRGGEEAREKFYQTCPPADVSDFRRQDGMRETAFRLYNEAAGANNRTCAVINYFRCPYGRERDKLTENGYLAEKLWEIVDWYNRHWNRTQRITPAESERKWYHWDEPSIIDVTNLEDILKACDDGRIDKITEEYERYSKERSY